MSPGQMVPGYNYYTIRSWLTQAFENQYRAGATVSVRMVGILFAPFDSSIAQDEVVPRLRRRFAPLGLVWQDPGHDDSC
jgi:hypothetical protein